MDSSSSTLWDCIEEARRASTLADLSLAASRYAGSRGFVHCGYAAKFQVHATSDTSNYLHFHNIPEPWGRERYHDTYPPESADRDALVLHLRTGQPPTAFCSTGVVTHTRPDVAKLGSQLLRRAGSYGLKAGLLVPLAARNMRWGFMVMTTPHTEHAADIVPELPDFHFFAHYVHGASQLMLKRFSPTARINAREREVLRWVGLGKTSWEIGVILNLQESTINFHLQSAARKLGVRGRRAACAQALSAGLIAL